MTILSRSVLFQVSKVFAFLVTDFGFLGPEFTEDNASLITTITFKGKNLAIQFILDERDQDITCKIAQVINSTTTTCYAVDSTGKHVRESLVSMVARKGVRGRFFTKTLQVPFETTVSITLNDYAYMLKTHGAEILADSPSVFI